jgi:hypothetical protein
MSSSSIVNGGGNAAVRYQAEESPGIVVGELWIDSDGQAAGVNANDYLTIISAGNTYLTQTSASNTYITIANSASGTQTLSNKTLTAPVLNNATINTPVSTTRIVSQSASYTITLADRDSIVEVSSSGSASLTIPLNSTTAFPIGSSLSILQTGTGQITIAGAGGVTVNATPGFRTRTQWSMATIVKRGTDTWVATGDLIA